MIRKFVFCIFFIWVTLHADESLEEFNQKKLDYDTAVYRTLTQSLSLRIANHNTHAKYNEVRQARLLPNPEFAYVAENFGGDRHYEGWNNREEMFVLSQLWETAGKRRLRTRVASYQYYAAMVGYDVSKLVLLNNLSKTFVSVLAAQEFLSVAEDQAKISRDVLEIATKKVGAGKVSLIEQNKAEVALTNALIAVEKAVVEFRNAKRRLALLWSSTVTDFGRVSFPFFEITKPIAFENCLTDLCNQPEIVQSLYFYWNMRKNWKLEKANSVPNVTLSFGYKVNHRERSHGLVAGVSLPLPIFNRNQGNIGRAYFDMLKTGDQGRELWLLLESKLAITYEELIQAYEEAERIKAVSLPAATQAFELAEKGYRAGKFEYLDVLDAQRTLFQEREKYLQALVNYHNRRSDIDYLNSQTK